MSLRSRAASRVLLVLLAGLAVALPARAHRGSTKYLVVERVAGEVRVQMELEVVDAAVALGAPRGRRRGDGPRPRGGARALGGGGRGGLGGAVAMPWPRRAPDGGG